MNKRLLMGIVVTILATNTTYSVEGDMHIESATRNIFTSAQMFFSALTVLPPKLKVIVASLNTVKTDAEKQIEQFNNSENISVKLHAVAGVLEQLAIGTELILGSYIPQGGAVDYGNHNFPGLVTDIAKIVAIGDVDTATKIAALLPIIQDKIAYVDVIAQSLHQVATDFSQTKVRSNIFEQTQLIIEAINNVPAQITLISNTFNKVITTLKADYEIFIGEGNLPNKVEAVADMVDQLAVVAELCVGSKLLPNNTVDAANHSFAGVLNDINHVLTALDPETGAKFEAILSVAHEKVGYLDLVSIALRKVAGNLAKMNNSLVVTAH